MIHITGHNIQSLENVKRCDIALRIYACVV